MFGYIYLYGKTIFIKSRKFCVESSEVIVDILALRLHSGSTGGHQSINK